MSMKTFVLALISASHAELLHNFVKTLSKIDNFNYCYDFDDSFAETEKMQVEGGGTPAL